MDNIIILNPDEKARLDYEQSWKDLMSFEDYLSVLAQRKSYEANAKGYETTVR
jgi:hypothetical protein